MKIQKTIVVILLSGGLWVSLAAAPYDDCSNAFVLRKLDNWCSSPAQFNNVGATASGLPNPECFPAFLMDSDNDVWFRFVAAATSVNISVVGAVSGHSQGTLRHPQLAVYRGSCSKGLKLVACISDGTGRHIVETFVNKLTPGETYYLRVDGRNNQTGTFQLCVNNFNPVASPSGDCSTAMVLCDESSFTIPKMQGVGRDAFELTANLCVKEESSAAWFKWRCDKPGPLTFTLNPVNPGDDLDFVLFLLPGGVDNCAVKIPVRCMASGETVNLPYSEWQRCTGATGLRSGETDQSEIEGCDISDNNFVAPVEMQAGESYALLVNNYHNTGNGFSVEFGGSGTFAGPNPHFTVSKLKIEQNQELWLRDASDFSGSITGWQWNFGLGASPQTAATKGPHKVLYKEPGKKSITLSIETKNGCLVSKTRTVTVLKAPDPDVEEAPTNANPGTDTPQAHSSSEASLLPDETAEQNGLADEQTDEPAASATGDQPFRFGHHNQVDTTTAWVNYVMKYIGEVYFVADSFNLDEDDYSILDEMVGILKANPDWTALLEGFGNSIPSDEYVRKLSAQRAQSVADYLIYKGVAAERLTIKAMGKKEWQVKDYSLYRRRKDQRVDVRILERQD